MVQYKYAEKNEVPTKQERQASQDKIFSKTKHDNKIEPQDFF